MLREICHPERSLSSGERRSRRTCFCFAPLILAAFSIGAHLHAQLASSSEPASRPAPFTPAQTFHDPNYHLSFNYPANWTFSHTDREISTFHLDARSAPGSARLRAVVAIPENPFPASTFSGAYVYFSVIPHASPASCAAEAHTTTFVRNTPETKPGVPIQIADVPFTHGHDEVKEICLTQHDEIYTAHHAGSCYRFDLAINNFCGGEVSGVKDITPAELEQVRSRLFSIFSTLRFDPK